ncbi:hypothetical protein B0H16DRAFT_1520966 [Mycena metata]|uniref:F-box domain-containing protein n=1 Tax=Mycena metata TaxID=1033252 RepID=A0AAD7NMS2_9AGAR|nr:hypothetical protein B0H16DRAFT_1540674 [Mycena metata]KAJ7767129.1 hypothetical protein B0H16DRAFT_1520966 [Mycena metata]
MQAASPTNISRDATRYPIESRIPPDILELIFEAGARSAQRQSSTFPKPIELVVSHVNRRWREIAVNLAMLWSFIRASPFEALDKLETYFERSKNHALRVCLFAYKAYWSPDILEWMRPHLHRVRQFHLVTDFVHSTLTVGSHFMGFDMPALETFLFTPLDFAEFESPSTPPLLPFTSGAPLLTSIRLNGPTLGLINPPFSGITQLCLAERFPINFRSICEILNSCDQLVRFSFSGHTQRPHRRLATPAEVFPFTLPQLRYLMLSHGGNSDVILTAMTAPKLCALRLNNFDEGDLAYFLQLSESSKFPVLESLSLLDNTFSVDEYHDIARIFPAIRSFSCLNSSYTDDVLEFLVPLPTSSSATHMPWPNLGALSFSQAQFTEKHQAMLCNLVSARAALRSPILNLFLGYANRLLLDPDRLEWLGERLGVDDSAEMPEDEQMRFLVEFSCEDVW